MDDLKEFKRLASDAGLTGGESLDLFDADPDFLKLVRTNKKFLGIMKQVFGDLVVDDGTGVDTIISADLAIQLGSAGTNKSTLQALANSQFDYLDILEDQANLARVGQINRVASKFTNNPEQFDQVMNNLDKLDEIDAFFTEFGAINTQDENGNDIVFRDNARIAIFFSEIADLDNLLLFKSFAQQNDVAVGYALDVYANYKDYLLEFIDVFERKDEDEQGLPVLVHDQQRISVLFENLSDLDNLIKFTELSELNNVSPELSIDSYAKDKDFILGFIEEFESVVSDNEGNENLIFDFPRISVLFEFLEQIEDLKEYAGFARIHEIEPSFAVDRFAEESNYITEVIRRFSKVETDQDGENNVNYDDSRISILFDHLDNLQDLKEFSQLTDQTGLISLDFAYDLYAKDPGYLQVARTDLVFLTMLYEGPVSLC